MGDYRAWPVPKERKAYVWVTAEFFQMHRWESGVEIWPLLRKLHNLREPISTLGLAPKRMELQGKKSGFVKALFKPEDLTDMEKKCPNNKVETPWG